MMLSGLGIKQFSGPSDALTFRFLLWCTIIASKMRDDVMIWTLTNPVFSLDVAYDATDLDQVFPASKGHGE